MAADGDAAAGQVRVSSAGQFDLGPASVAAFDLQAGRFTVTCSSGERETGEWRGVVVADLLERAEPAAEATHLVVTGADDYRVCVPLVDALDALVAVERLDAPAEGSLPRFLGASVGGTRSVKRVRRLETVALAPDEDASTYEELFLGEDG